MLEFPAGSPSVVPVVSTTWSLRTTLPRPSTWMPSKVFWSAEAEAQGNRPREAPPHRSHRTPPSHELIVAAGIGAARVGHRHPAGQVASVLARGAAIIVDAETHERNAAGDHHHIVTRDDPH